jgi:PTS system nitrogen regulatory IIA component
VLLARETLGSTALGDGIAIPHLRNPIVLPVPRATVCLCFLENPIEFGATDGKPVHTLFILVSPTVRDHAHQLSRLASFLREPGFRGAIERRAPGDEILRQACRVEPQISSRELSAG